MGHVAHAPLLFRSVSEHRHGIEGFKHVNRWVRAGFSDAHYEIEDMIAEGAG